MNRSFEVTSTAFVGCNIFFSIPRQDIYGDHQRGASCISSDYKEDKLHNLVELGGGEIVSAPDCATHVVIWHMQQPDAEALTTLCAKTGGPELCSILWLFACLEANSLLSNRHPLYSPFPSMAISVEAGSVPLRVSVTGFQLQRRAMVKFLLASMGVEFHKELHLSGEKMANALVAYDLRECSQKLKAARDKGIPAVTLQWVLDSLQLWKVLPAASFTDASGPVSIIFSTAPLPSNPVHDPDVISDSEDKEKPNESDSEDKEPPNEASRENAPLAYITGQHIQQKDGLLPSMPSSGKGAASGGVLVTSATQAMGVVENLVAALGADTQQSCGDADDHARRSLLLLSKAIDHPASKENENVEYEGADGAGRLGKTFGNDDRLLLAQPCNEPTPTPTPSQLSVDVFQQSGAILDDDQWYDAGGGTCKGLLPATEVIPPATLLQDGESVGEGEREEDLASAGISRPGKGDAERVVVEAIASEIENGPASPEVEAKTIKSNQRCRKHEAPARAPWGHPQADEDREGDEKVENKEEEKPKRRKQHKVGVSPPPPPPRRTPRLLQQGSDEPFIGCENTVEKDPPARTSKKRKRRVEGSKGAAVAPEKKARSSGTQRVSKIHIALSGLHREEQEQLLKLAKSLDIPCTGGNHAWNPKFTHILASEVKRNPKCLAALARGAWLVRPSFLEACCTAGRLVPEGPHELVLGSGNVEKGVATHWREQAAIKGCGAFSGLTFALDPKIPGPPSREDLGSIIKAGGGKVVPMRMHADVVVVPLSSSKDSANADVHRRDDGAMFVTPMYIVDWIANPHASLDDHVLLKSRRRTHPAALAAATRGAAQI